MTNIPMTFNFIENLNVKNTFILNYSPIKFNTQEHTLPRLFRDYMVNSLVEMSIELCGCPYDH